MSTLRALRTFEVQAIWMGDFNILFLTDLRLVSLKVKIECERFVGFFYPVGQRTILGLSPAPDTRLEFTLCHRQITNNITTNLFLPFFLI